MVSLYISDAGNGAEMLHIFCTQWVIVKVPYKTSAIQQYCALEAVETVEFYGFR